MNIYVNNNIRHLELFHHSKTWYAFYGIHYSIGYVTLDTSHATVGQHVPVSSPSFTGQGVHCLAFDYKVWVSRMGLVNMPAPRLELYIRISRHVYSGWKLWTSNGTGDGHIQISVQTRAKSTYWISFVGVVGHLDTTLISVANIRLNEDKCNTTDCRQEVCVVNQENDLSLECKYNEFVRDLSMYLYPKTIAWN